MDEVLNIDNQGEIIPAKGAAGLTLGIKKAEINKRLLDSFEFIERINPYVPQLSPIQVYRTKDIVLYFENESLAQIELTGDYKGKLSTNLGLGNLVCDFEKEYGQLMEGDEDELTFSNLYGLCFEVDFTKCNSDNWETEIPKLPVIKIFIFE